MSRERRINLVLLEYWLKVKGDRLMPEENDIDPDALGDVWDHCFLIQVRDIHNVIDYNYTYLGSRIVDAYAEGTVQPEDGLMISPNATKLSQTFEEIIENKKPLMEDGEFVTISGRTVKYRQCLLPLGDAQGTVHSIFGGMRFKLFDNS